MRAVLDTHPDLVNAGAAPDGWAERHPDRPLTRFEQRGLEAGRTVRDLHYRRR
jgi:tRNA (guanine-N7-)-methyltransferase